MKINTLTIPTIENVDSHEVESRAYNIQVIDQITAENVFCDDKVYFIIQHNIEDETVLKFYDIWLGYDIDSKTFSLQLVLRNEHESDPELEYLDPVIENDDDFNFIELVELTDEERAVIDQYVGLLAA